MPWIGQTCDGDSSGDCDHKDIEFLSTNLTTQFPSAPWIEATRVHTALRRRLYKYTTYRIPFDSRFALHGRNCLSIDGLLLAHTIRRVTFCLLLCFTKEPPHRTTGDEILQISVQAAETNVYIWMSAMQEQDGRTLLALGTV